MNPSDTGTSHRRLDPTVLAVPAYFATIGLEYRALKARARRQGPSAPDYERRDTIASLSMGVASLFAPAVMKKVLRPITPGKGRFGKALVATAAAAVAATTAADVVARRSRSDRARRMAEPVAAAGGVAAIVTGGLAATTTWASRTTVERMWGRRLLRDKGAGVGALAAAVLGWDFIYYWNHRLMHESRFMWAVHVPHHSSQRYNLSTALRQPVAESIGLFVPYSLLALVGIRPDLITQARGINLLYQYWIHTDTIRRIGPVEEVLNSPSHHRVHHGSNRQYIDRNHGSILILWDRLFGTFEREREPVVYGLTRNIDTFNLGRIITHEYADMLADVARSTTWRDRLSYVLRGPGWAYAHRQPA